MMKLSVRIAALFTAVLAVVAGTSLPRGAGSQRGVAPYDLVITNARVVDGAGNPWFRADVAVKGERIARVGSVAPAEGARVVDAGGMILAPGFIDVHTHAEDI